MKIYGRLLIMKFSIIAVSFSVLLTSCVHLSTDVQFYIVSSHDNSHIQVNKGAIRFLTSPHADGYDGYSFVVPRGLDHIHASEILSAKFERNALTFSDNSEILIDSGSASCSLTLKLFDNKGKASILNGTYVVKEYAGAAFKRCQR